jgi:heat shock protein HtpX
MSGKTVSYTVETEVPSNYLGNLLDYVYQKYLSPQKERFRELTRRIVDDVPYLSFVAVDPKGKQDLSVEVKGSSPIKIEITPLTETALEQRIDEVKHDVVIAIQFFEEKMRKSTIYFAWEEGTKIIPEKISGNEKKPINRMFLETQILFFIVFIVFGMFLFIVIASYFPGAFWIAPLVLIVIQFVFVFYSNKFIARTADWHITEDNPTIHLLEYHLPLGEHDDFKQAYPQDKLVAIKKEVYEEIIAKQGEINCEAAQKVFSKYGVECQPENLSTKKVNVYELVKKIADKFHFPMPKIVVSNTMIPNAAASGPSPSRGVVLITTGLLVQLEEDEIISVLGHEFGHLKGRDPLWLYGLTSAEFLFRFYVLFPLFPYIFYSFLFFIYFWLVMAVIYFIAKFFEARADLISAIVIGQPDVLAEALEKIGFRRLLYERAPSFRIQEWTSFDPHPPIYFRVERLEKLKLPLKIKYPLVQSLKDVTRGFLQTLGL